MFEQCRVGPGEHIVGTHAGCGVAAEARADVLVQEESVGISLAIGHQQQHPHETNVRCERHQQAFLNIGKTEFFFLLCVIQDYIH